MKESFENKLHQFSDMIEIPKKKDGDLDKEKLQKVKEWLLKGASESTSTSVEVQKKIFELQRRKQDIMDDLKKKLKFLADGAYESVYSKHAALITEQDGILFIGGNPITLGELMSDIDWGVTHQLDKSVPRAIHKKYLVERAKNRLSPLLDEQIIEEEKNSTKTHEWRQKAYEKLSMDHTRDRERQAGFIAERMVKSLLKKISIDVPDVNFEIVEADAEHDVNRKIDFILVKKDHDRGVGVEARHVQGIQFTTNLDQLVATQKQIQIDRAKKMEKKGGSSDHIEDIVLVTASVDDVKGKYQNWLHNKKPGGPDQLWSTQTKLKIVQNVLKDFLDIDTIEKIKQSIVEKENAPQMAEA